MYYEEMGVLFKKLFNIQFKPNLWEKHKKFFYDYIKKERIEL